jgi:fused signal recognition particle receptor
MDAAPILADLTALIRAEPWLLVLVTGLGPLLIGLVIERVGRRGAAAADGAEMPSARAPIDETSERAEPESDASRESDRSSDAPRSPEIDGSSDALPSPAPDFVAEGPPAPSTDPTPPVELSPVEPPAPRPETAPTPPPAVLPDTAPTPPPARLRDRLLRTRETLLGRMGGILGSRAVDAALLEELEEVLFTADLGVATAESLLDRIRNEGRGASGEAVRDILKTAIREKLQTVQPEGDPHALLGKPHVILVLGVNGAGKTTTIGKLAAQHQALGRKVLLGAGDTFRAAAIEQLQTWGQRVGCEVIAGEAGGDPASVAFDAVQAAVARGADVAIIDTAGRLQTKKPLMEELSKIVRVIGRDVEAAPHEILLVLDANTGQNAISQARLFAEAAAITGLVLTKMDGTAKGGVIVGLADEFRLPVRFVGVGEGIDDLRQFDAGEFVAALFGED